MVPIVEEALRSSTSSNSTQPYAATPDGSIEEAIEMGDWAAVGATAAILASSKSSVGARVEADDDYSDSSVESDVDDDDDSSSRDSSGRVRYGVETTDSDVARAAEIDRLVESGNWDGVVAVAARYVEEADEADEQLKRPLRRGGSPSSRIAESDVESVSIETADESSAYTDSSRESTYATSGNNTAGSRTGTSSSNDANATRSRSNTSTSSDVGSRNVVGETVATLSESVSSTSDVQTISTHSSSSHHRRRKNAYRAEVEALVRRVVPDELSNVDDILVQFSGREQELIDTLRAMQEKSIAQRARAAVQRSAKKEAGKSGRDPMDDESSDGNSSSQPDRSVATQDPSERLSNQSPRDRRDSESITSQFAETETEEYSMSESSEGASYTTGASDSRSGTNGSEYSGPGKVRYDTTRASTGLVDAIDASDWRAVGANANELRRGREDSVSPPLGTTGIKDMVEEGNWSGITEAASNMTRNGEIEDLD
ncbi:hypothetical protein ACHAXA_008921 [Cyclostephanos tholiformis]|uniref:Uncharacterized protein n=1 Tax=Cyclostephanos tholiformis TaxID=382380 RepID=A0ABD3R5E7_9STRA